MLLDRIGTPNLVAKCEKATKLLQYTSAFEISIACIEVLGFIVTAILVLKLRLVSHFLSTLRNRFDRI